jgi:hypothetical protein
MSPDPRPRAVKWVFYIDPVLFPFDNSGLAARNTDQAAFMPNQTKLQQRFRQQAGLTSAPADWPCTSRSSPECSRTTGAARIAVKFEIAYFRSFVFDDPPRGTASSRSTPLPAGRRAERGGIQTFQDFVFRHVLTECGRLRLPVHLHSSAGAATYFSISGVNVLKPRAGAARSAIPVDDLRADPRRHAVRISRRSSWRR